MRLLPGKDSSCPIDPVRWVTKDLHFDSTFRSSRLFSRPPHLNSISCTPSDLYIFYIKPAKLTYMAFTVSRSFVTRSSLRRLVWSRDYLHPRNRLLAESIKPYGSSSAKEQFKIRKINTEEEFKNVIVNWMVEEGWRPGLKDAECFLACDPSAAFVGELNAKPIACATMTKYADRFNFGGCYVVSKEHREKGYGRMLYDAAMASAMPSCSIAIAGLLHLEELYKRKGFRSQFYGARFDLHPPTAITRLSEISERCHGPVNIKCIEEVDLQALFKYDAAVFGAERHAFLTKWFRIPGKHGRVAINSEGSIVGYTVARPSFVKKEGYKIGPLFADSEPIAEKLLKAVFEELLQEEPVPVVCIDALTKKAKEMSEKLQGKKSFEIVYMVMYDLPGACFDKWFGMTTLELG